MKCFPAKLFDDLKKEIVINSDLRPCLNNAPYVGK